MAVSVERLRPTDPTGRVPVRVQDELCVDEGPRGDSLVQNLTKSNSGCHGCKMIEGVPFVIGRVYSIRTVQHVHPFRVKQVGGDDGYMVWSDGSTECLGLDDSKRIVIRRQSESPR